MQRTGEGATDRVYLSMTLPVFARVSHIRAHPSTEPVIVIQISDLDWTKSQEQLSLCLPDVCARIGHVSTHLYMVS